MLLFQCSGEDGYVILNIDSIVSRMGNWSVAYSDIENILSLSALISLVTEFFIDWLFSFVYNVRNPFWRFRTNDYNTFKAFYKEQD